MRYQIADCIVEYEPIYEFLRKKMESYRYDGDAKTQITLTMTEELCIQKQAEQPHLTLEECEYIFVGLEFYRKLLLQGGMMIHASAAEFICFLRTVEQENLHIQNSGRNILELSGH